MINPFQIMGLIGIYFFLIYVEINMIHRKVWIQINDQVYYDEDYYWDYWLPARIETLEEGYTDAFYEPDQLDDLKKVLDDHLNGRDLI